MGAFRRLLEDGLEDRGMVVAEDHRAVAAPPIDVAVAVDVPLVGAIGAHDVERERREDAPVVGGAARHHLQRALVQRFRFRPCVRVFLLDRLGHGSLLRAVGKV